MIVCYYDLSASCVWSTGADENFIKSLNFGSVNFNIVQFHFMLHTKSQIRGLSNRECRVKFRNKTKVVKYNQITSGTVAASTQRTQQSQRGFKMPWNGIRDQNQNKEQKREKEQWTLVESFNFQNVRVHLHQIRVSRYDPNRWPSLPLIHKKWKERSSRIRHWPKITNIGGTQHLPSDSTKLTQVLSGSILHQQSVCFFLFHLQTEIAPSAGDISCCKGSECFKRPIISFSARCLEPSGIQKLKWFIWSLTVISNDWNRKATDSGSISNSPLMEHNDAIQHILRSIV